MENGMATTGLRSILVATDMTAVSDVVVRQAGAIAKQTGAALHALHVVPGPRGRHPGGGPAAESVRDAVVLLADQLRRCVPGVEAASAEVRFGVPHSSIGERGREVSADLMVIGPHGGRGFRARVLGTTADRVLREARVPCLVVRRDTALPWTRLAVPTDLSVPARNALRLALDWAPLLGSDARDGASAIFLVHVAWAVERENPGFEKEVLRPALRNEVEAVRGASGIDVRTELLWSFEPSETLVRWARRRAIDLLVVPASGDTAVRRAILGSTSSTLARRAPCSVLLIPAGRETAPRAPRIDRVVIGVDFTDPSNAAVAWTTQHFAAGAEHVLVHAMDVMHPPAFLDHGTSARADLVEGARLLADRRMRELSARLGLREPRVDLRDGRADEVLSAAVLESGADLVVVGEHTNPRDVWSPLGTTAERLVRCSPVPVLLVRGAPERTPRRILAAIDSSDTSDQVLAWAHFLTDRLNAELAVCHALSPAFLGRARLVSGIAAGRRLEDSYRDQGTEWVHARLEQRPEDFTKAGILVPVGNAGFEILAAQARDDFDFIVIGSRGEGAVASGFIGSVASTVLRGATCPVLVVRHDGWPAT
jgi:nucleotide-binding universal stress UspA family protein